MFRFRRRHISGNYEVKKKKPLLLISTVVFSVLFIGFLVYTSIRGTVSAKDLRHADTPEETALVTDTTEGGLNWAQLKDVDGILMYDNNGSPLYVDEEGNIFTLDENSNRKLCDWDGNLILADSAGQLYVDPYGNYYTLCPDNRRVLRDEYTSPVYDAGRRQMYVDGYGNYYVLDEDGRKLLVTGVGDEIVDLNGNNIQLSETEEDSVYATQQTERKKNALAADVSYDNLHDASESFGEAYKTNMHAAAMKTREALHSAADRTGEFIRTEYGDAAAGAGDASRGISNSLHDSAKKTGEALHHAADQTGDAVWDMFDGESGIANESINSAGEKATGGINDWWSTLVNDWEKLKKDIVTPASEYRDGNVPNPVSNEEHELFQWEDK